MEPILRGMLYSPDAAIQRNAVFFPEFCLEREARLHCGLVPNCGCVASRDQARQNLQSTERHCYMHASQANDSCGC